MVSSLNHVLPVGSWEYRFSFPLRPDLPGCVKYFRSERAVDPEWHNRGRMLETRAGIVYTFKAAIQNGAVFAKEIRGRQELVVNAFFDINKLRPAHSETIGTVRLCCCIPRGKVRGPVLHAACGCSDHRRVCLLCRHCAKRMRRGVRGVQIGRLIARCAT